MANLGRNDPCWCGSGKKYKNCHMREDERAESRNLVTRNLIERLDEYALQREFQADFESSFEFYFGRKFRVPDDQDGAIDLQRALDYFIHDYRLPDGKRVIERFSAEHGERLTPDERALIEDWRHSRYSAFEVIAIARGVSMRLRDLVSGEEFDVLEKHGTEDLSRWEIVVSRLMRVRDHYEMGGASGMRLPAGYRDWLRSYLDEQWDRYQINHPESDYEEFSHASSQLLNRYIENEILPALTAPPTVVTAEGDLSEFCTATFDVVDYPAARAGLSAAEEFNEGSAGEDESGAISFGWQEVGASLDLLRAHGPAFEHQQAMGAERGGIRNLGNLSLTRAALTLEATSRRRLEAGKALLAARLGRAIQHRADEIKSMDEVLAQMPAEPEEGPPEAELPEELEAMQAEMAAQYHRQWLDQSIPALKGQTPRDAVKTFGGRVRVLRLLKEFEASEDHAARAGDVPFDVGELKRELGITDQDLLQESRLEDQMKDALDEMFELTHADRVDTALAAWRSFRGRYPLTSLEDLEFAQIWDLGDIVDDVLMNLGYRLASLKRYDAAMALLEEYLALGPVNPEAVRADLAEIRVERGEMEQGVHDLEQLVAEAPESFAAVTTLADVQRDLLHRPDDAIETLRHALDQVEEDWQGEVYDEILGTYLEFNRLDQAEQFWHAENDPEAEEDKDYLGWTKIMLARGNWDAARMSIEKVQNEVPRTYWLGMVEARAGNFDKASELWEKELEEPKFEDWFLWAEWAELRLRLHQVDRVIEKVNPRKLHATAMGYWYLALAYAAKGDLARATEWARAARVEMERRSRTSHFASIEREVHKLADALRLSEAARQLLERSFGGVPMTNYVPPVDKLLTLGDPKGRVEWHNYRDLGIGEEHVPDLIRMALDEDLLWADSESAAVWAPVHAWRALGELRAQAAIEPLLDLFREIDEHGDDWIGEELPEVYGLIGPAAIPALAAYLADPSHGLWARVGASSSLKEIGSRHPASRAESVTVLTRQLERFADNDPTLNGSILDELLELHAAESAPVIERAFAAKAIDESIAGDWEDVQVELGLKDKRTTPRPPSPLAELFDQLASQTTAPPQQSNPQVESGIHQTRAEGVLKSAAKPKREKHKKKHKRKKR